MQAGLRYQLLYPTIVLSFVTIAFYRRSATPSRTLPTRRTTVQ